MARQRAANRTGTQDVIIYSVSSNNSPWSCLVAACFNHWGILFTLKCVTIFSFSRYRLRLQYESLLQVEEQQNEFIENFAVQK